MRAAAAYAFGRLGTDEASPALRRLLHDPDPHVRQRASDALSSLLGVAACAVGPDKASVRGLASIGAGQSHWRRLLVELAAAAPTGKATGSTR